MNDDIREEAAVYACKHVNGYNTRSHFLRSMDLANANTIEDAFRNYAKKWFTVKTARSKPNYLSRAFDMISRKQRSIFWSYPIFNMLLDEISIDAALAAMDQVKLKSDVNTLRERYGEWCRGKYGEPNMKASIRAFEKKYSGQSCPDTFISMWMNNGAYITLAYGIKYGEVTLVDLKDTLERLYDDIAVPDVNDKPANLSLLENLAFRAAGDMNHDIDTRLFEMCYEAYSGKADI